MELVVPDEMVGLGGQAKSLHGHRAVFRFSGESLCASDDDAIGIIFLLEAVTVRTSTCRDRSR